jgi:hypothetical protein
MTPSEAIAQLRELPADKAEIMLDALLDRAWSNGANAALCEPDSAEFLRHVDERRSKARSALEALALAGGGA